MSLQTGSSISLRTFKYWVAGIDIYQSVLIDDVLPGVEVVVLDDVIIEDPVGDRL
jgi:hypothetical protein